MKKTISALVMLCVTVFSGVAHATLIVEPGFDLLETTSPTDFLGIEFEGVEIALFDFGGSPGVQAVGNADTIVRRLEQGSVAVAGDTATIEIELVALQLRSVAPVDLGAGLDLHYITLGSTPSVGEMAINFASINGGMFDSFIDVFFDVRIGALNGPVLFSDNLRLSSNNTAWGRTPPPGAVLIEGVNRFLAGTGNPEHDFWPDDIEESHPTGATHSVTSARVPEPAAFALMGLALAAFGFKRRKSA